MLVGGAGYMFTKFGNVMPGMTDKLMERFMGEEAQTTDTPPEPAAEDNLFEARADGRTRSNQGNRVRKTSLALEAQMHPLTTAALTVGAAAAAVAIGLAGSRGRSA